MKTTKGGNSLDGGKSKLAGFGEQCIPSSQENQGKPNTSGKPKEFYRAAKGKSGLSLSKDQTLKGAKDRPGDGGRVKNVR